MPGTSDAVHELVSTIDYPMYIVTVAAGDERAGCLVGFTTQCSVDPPRFMACLSDKNRTFRVAQGAEVLVVHLVPDDAEELAERFGSETGDDVDKFREVDWEPGPGGAPVLAACRNWFAGRILDRRPVGDHWAFLLEPIEAASDPDEDAFRFHRARRLEPGHEA
jgi:flavin reductase (DIM6/NTAB) family NADH-FMN oxidoreductase RutF